eukprot:COSAG02_NODE_1245_length_13662_cov_4.594338_2_plen_264_part_00
MRGTGAVGARVLLQVLWAGVVVRAAGASLCARTRAKTSNGWTNAELVAFWQTQARSGSRLHSPINRPQLVSALDRSPDAVPNQITVPKEFVTAAMDLNAVNTIDEKGRSFEGDGELRLQWYDERLCFNSSLWSPTVDKDCRCPESDKDCRCVVLRGEDMGNFTTWMWVPSSAPKALEPRGDVSAGGAHSYTHQEQRLVISSDGNVTWHKRFVEEFEAEFDETKMPFDQQMLSIRIGKSPRASVTVAAGFDVGKFDCVGRYLWI